MGELRFNKDERKFLINVLNWYSNNAKNPKESQRLVKKIEKSMKPIKTSSAKAKGRDLQYSICHDIASMYVINFDQNDDNCPIHSRDMGQHNVDIVLRGEIYENFKFDIECKAQENLSLGEWIAQAKANQKEGRDWMLIIKKQSIGDPFVVLDWVAFMDIWTNTHKFMEYWG